MRLYDSAKLPMTYCVGLTIDEGLVFMSDTRTNAGIDAISTFSKMHIWSEPGERVVVLLTAGNLATTQSVVSLLDERTKAVSERAPTLLETPSMYQTARLVGNAVKEVIASSVPEGHRGDSYFNASFILGGQIRGSEPRLFLIYPEGNFIEASNDTPFFQIGETKYGKPIIVRAYDRTMTFAETAKLLLVSFDSTLKSNLSVGLPLDLFFYRKDSLKPGLRKRIGYDDPYYRTISDGWSNALKNAFKSLPDFPDS
jgi:putative proteasome-type protease